MDSLRPLTAQALSPAGALSLTPMLSLMPAGNLPALAATVLVLGVLSYAWWYHAGQPAGFAATRDEVVEDVRAARDRLAAAWRRVTGKRGRGNA